MPASTAAPGLAQVVAGVGSTASPPPKLEFVFEAIVVGEGLQKLGQGPLGERRMIPIAGGTFIGPRLQGVVLPGSADRQLLRKDGVQKLNALFELRTLDGAVITVNDHVIMDFSDSAKPYVFSSIEIVAPDGPYGWLNKQVFVGTLDNVQGQAAVRVRVYALT